MRDRLEAYVDGLLDSGERREVEEALAREPALRAKLEEVRRFAGLLEDLDPGRRAVRHAVARVRRATRRRGALRRLAAAAAVVAAAVTLAVAWPRPAAPEAWVSRLEHQSLAFGRRLGAIAEERRRGRVPRTGVGDLEVPPAATYGVVFRGALEELGIGLEDGVAREVGDLVMRHHLATRGRGQDLEAECVRAEASLKLYRRLCAIAGPEVADAYYDVFRAGRADPETTRRVRPGTLAFVVEDAREYRTAYEKALAALKRRYGAPSVEVVLAHLAPRDRRVRWYDAAQEGVSRDVVLAVRAQLYQAACDAGADRLYVEG